MLSWLKQWWFEINTIDGEYPPPGFWIARIGGSRTFYNGVSAHTTRKQMVAGAKKIAKALKDHGGKPCQRQKN